MTVRAMPGLVLLCALLPLRIQGQTRPPDVTRELELFESTERGLDPLGLDEGTGKQLDEAARRLEEARRRAAAPKPLSATRGEVLSSVEGVQEVAHQVRVQLAQGLAFVSVELRFEARAAAAAELAYRLPLPEGATAYQLAVCRGARCVEAEPERLEAPAHAPRAGQDWAEAHPIRDARGPALALRAGGLQRGAGLGLRVQYVAPAELHAGATRFRLPARGYDPRIAPSEISLDAPNLAEPDPAGPVSLDPNLPLALSARLPASRRGAREVARGRCGGRDCSRAFEAASAAPALARETWLLLDASPSMEGRARNAADRALTGLLSLLPEETPLRVFAFAARARELGKFVAAQAPLALLSDALSEDLGGASRPGAALQLARANLARTRPRVLLLSDGKLDQNAIQELAQLRKLGAELWWVALHDAPSGLAQVCEGVVRFAAEPDAARAEELLSAALAPRAAGGLPAGEQRVVERGPTNHVPRAGESWLSFWFARGHPPALRTPGGADPGAVAAPAFVSQPPSPAAADTGMPKESVLSLLRNQLIPQARGCLRSDRKGRADYAVALTFHALFADREAYDVRIEGKLPDALRKCLSEVVPRLRVPPFSGRIRVRYPIHTEREPESPVIELEGEALEQVNRVIGAGSHTVPPLP